MQHATTPHFEIFHKYICETIKRYIEITKNFGKSKRKWQNIKEDKDIQNIKEEKEKEKEVIVEKKNILINHEINIF